MKTPTRSRAKPRIVLCEEDHDRLAALADTLLDSSPELADVLFAEIQRANVVKRAALPATVARMGSRVTFRTEDGRERTVTLVFPREADIAQGRLSILTPVGAALIGLSEGHSMTWAGRNDSRHELTVLSVSQDSDEATPA